MAEALRSLSYEEWLAKAKYVLSTRCDFARPRNEYRDEIDLQIRSFQGGWLFYDANVLPSNADLKMLSIMRHGNKFADPVSI
jgi:hypothetical protein